MGLCFTLNPELDPVEVSALKSSDGSVILPRQSCCLRPRFLALLSGRCGWKGQREGQVDWGSGPALELVSLWCCVMICEGDPAQGLRKDQSFPGLQYLTSVHCCFSSTSGGSTNWCGHIEKEKNSLALTPEIHRLCNLQSGSGNYKFLLKLAHGRWETHTRMFPVLLCTITRTWTQPRWPSLEKQLDSLRHGHTMEYYPAVQTN